MSTQIYQTYSFLPTQISGCQIWLDGADLTTLFTDIAGTTPVSASGQSVAYWKDKSTQANNATNSTNQPTVTYNSQNGLSAVSFNGSSQFLNLTPSKLPNGSTNFSYFFVVRTSSTAVQVFMANGTTVTNQMPQFYFSNYALVGDLFGGSATSDSTTYNNQFVVASYTGSSSFTGYDFNSTFSGAAASVTLNTGTTWALLGVSRTVTPSPSYVFYLAGQIAEVIVYNRVVNTSEREQLQAYLGWKWDLEANFTSGFTYKTNPPFMNTIQLPITPTRPIQISNTPVFVPTQISGCQVWFDAADKSTFSITGSNITQWRDKSSNAYSIGQATTARQPFYIPNAQNGLAAVQLATARWIFTESSNMPNFTTSAATSVFVAARNGTTGTGYNAINSVWISGASALTTRYQLFFDRDSGSLSRGPNLYLSGTFRIQNTTNVVAASTAGVVGFTASASSILLSVNGNTSTAAGAAPTSANDATYFQFGDSRGISTLSSDVQIFEMIGYSTELTTAQRQQVEGYLAWKWGTQASLPTTHPYYKSPFPNQSMAPIPPFPPQITSSSWQPTKLSACSLWLDASDPSFVVVSGTAVTQWKDKSGSNNNTNSANGSPQYIYASLNKRAGISFNGSTSYFTLPLVVSTDWSIFIVLTTKQTGPGSGGQWWAGAGIFDAEIGGTTTDFGISLYGSSFATGVGNPPTGDDTVLSSTSINTGNGFICEFIRNSTSGFFENFVNGSTQGSVNGGTGARTTSRIVLGAIQTLSAGNYFNGYLFEIITYTSVLSTSQRQQVEGYLAWKWGLQGSLPGNHPYKLFPPPP
jgi:nuclear transport factor 2 (NTF2) superfamily protein